MCQKIEYATRGGIMSIENKYVIYCDVCKEEIETDESNVFEF